MAVQQIAAARRTRKPSLRHRPGNGPQKASASYLALVSAYPIHPIRSEADLDDAIAVIDTLLSRRKPLDVQERDYLDSLSHEIERYEAVAYPMPRVSGAEMLGYLIEVRGTSLSRVGKETGIAVSTLSAIASAKRKLTIGHIRCLSDYFGVEPGVFLE